MRTALAALAFVVAAGSAQAADDWGATVLKTCTSIEAQTCLLKPETRVCSPKGRPCWYIGTDNYVAVRRVMGSRVLVDTVAGPATAPISALAAHAEE